MQEGLPLWGDHVRRNRTLVKMDYLFPTGSYKDRGATVLISKMKEWEFQKVVEDPRQRRISHRGLLCQSRNECEIYVPQGTSSEKTVQIQATGRR